MPPMVYPTGESGSPTFVPPPLPPDPNIGQSGYTPIVSGYSPPIPSGTTLLPQPIPPAQAAAAAPQSGAGLPVPIPSSIEHVITNLGIHPQSGLASAFRAIHAVLSHHLASQAAAHYGHAGLGSFAGHPGGPNRPGPTLQ